MSGEPRERELQRDLASPWRPAMALLRFFKPPSAHSRARSLPRLIALWPHELAGQSPESSVLILLTLRRALRAERRRALAGHWSYELNRHLGLMNL